MIAMRTHTASMAFQITRSTENVHIRHNIIGRTAWHVIILYTLFKNRFKIDI